MLTKKDVADTLGLSCVEKYFSAWLNQTYDVTRLYGTSFIALKQVFDDFAFGAQYQSYQRIPRLQDIAEDYGITEHAFYACDARRAVERLQTAPADRLCLVRVNADFFAAFKRAAWREDHYICMDSRLAWVNEYPLSEGVFDKARFAEVYGGALSVYTLRDPTPAPSDTMTDGFIGQDTAGIVLPHGLNEIEQAVGILRMTRKRAQAFYAENETVRALFARENERLDTLYFSVRMRKLQEKKGSKTDRTRFMQSLRDEVQAIVEIERTVAEILKS